MEMEEDESSESEEEVRPLCLHFSSVSNSSTGRILYRGLARAAPGQEAPSRVFSAQVGFYLPIGDISKVLTTSCPLPHCRAQKRVAQQRIHAKLPLTRIIDLRKKIFGQVKVIASRQSLARRTHTTGSASAILGLRSETTGLYRKSASPPIARSLPPAVGRVPSKYGMCLHVRPYERCVVSKSTGLLQAPRNNTVPSTGHADRVGGVAWHPQATLTQGEGLVNLVSGAGDMSVNLWSLSRCAASDTPPKSRH